MKKIPLTQGYFAIVDNEDYDYLMQWKWHILDGKRVYAMRNSKFIKGERRHHILMHRVINKTAKKFETDHINGNGLDNRKSNLRSVTRGENQRNRKQNKNCSSKYKGVAFHGLTGKWQAHIQIKNKRYYLGLYEKEIHASKVYNYFNEIQLSKIKRRK